MHSTHSAPTLSTRLQILTELINEHGDCLLSIAHDKTAVMLDHHRGTGGNNGHSSSSNKEKSNELN